MGLVATFLLGLFIGSLGGPPSGPSIGWRRVQIEVLVCSTETSLFPTVPEGPVP